MRRCSTCVVAICLLVLSAANVRSGVPIQIGEPFETSWGQGQIVDRGDGTGMGFAKFDRPPADGELVFPADLPPIVFGALSYRGQGNSRIDDPFEFDPQSGALILKLPTDPQERANVEGGGFAYAKWIVQNADGAIVFPAHQAAVRNVAAPGAVKAKLETNGSNVRIGFWTNPQDEVVWQYDATRWGRYQVRLVYATQSPDGALAQIEFGGETLDVELPSTGSWYRYRQIPAGEIYLAKDGKTELVVRAKKLSGPALMNLKAVVLEPTYESPERPQQADDGSLTLHASQALVRGTKLRYEPKPEKNTLGYWTVPTDGARWDFAIARPGTFDVEVLQGCGTGQGGSTMNVLFVRGESTNLEFVVEETGHFQNFRPRIVGRVVVPEAGPASLTIEPAKIAHAAACDVRQIRLIPVVAEAVVQPAP